MYNSQYYTCEQIDQRLLQGYLDDYNTENNTSLTKAQFLAKLGSILSVWQGVDNVPTAGSDNLVKSGGVSANIARIGRIIPYGKLISVTYVNNDITIIIPANSCFVIDNKRYRVTTDTTVTANRVSDLSSVQIAKLVYNKSTDGFTIRNISNTLSDVEYSIFEISLNTASLNISPQLYTWNGITAITDEINQKSNRTCIINNYGQKIKVTYESLILSVEIPVNTRLYKGGSVYTFAEDTTLTVDHTTLSQLQTLLLIIDGNNTFSFKRGDYTLADGEFIVFGISINTKTLSIPHQQYEWVDYYDDVFSRNAKIILYNKKIDFTKDGTTLRVTIPANTKIFCGQTLIEFDEDTVYEQDWSTINTVNIFCLTINIVTEGLYFQRTRITEPNKYIVFGVSLKTETLTLPDTQYTWNGVVTISKVVSKQASLILYNGKVAISFINNIVSVTIPELSVIRYADKRKVIPSGGVTITADWVQDLSSVRTWIIVYNKNDDALYIKKTSYVLAYDEFIVFGISLNTKSTTLPDTQYTWVNEIELFPKDDFMEMKLYESREDLPNNILPLNILHFSDVHGWPSALQRVIGFKNAYSSYIDDVLHTGDIVRSSWESESDFWNIDGAQYILNCIGNHDSALKENGVWDWTHYSDAECYQRYFAPYIENWGVNYTANHCYYYKDYTTNGRNIRLIVLNENMTDYTDQNTWLTNLLTDALTNQMHVIIASHSRKGGQIDTNIVNGNSLCSFTYKGSMEGSKNYVAACDIVQSFINNGGVFVCWLLGHAHCTSIGFNSTYPSQLQIFADVAYPARFKNDVVRRIGDNSEDSFHIFSIDQGVGIIRLIKVGTNYNKYMQKRDTICYDYINHKLVSDNGDVFI